MRINKGQFLPLGAGFALMAAAAYTVIMLTAISFTSGVVAISDVGGLQLALVPVKQNHSSARDGLSGSMDSE